ncbi:MAG: DUF309 domain-containing protein [Deltaproteobacteria bacterium]|nr:MAG: DUF309 domain-containing protein [Deltaproteobacteria bacterium]
MPPATPPARSSPWMEAGSLGDRSLVSEPPDPPDPRVLEGIALIRRRCWFQAHEVLELAWREAAPPYKHWLQGLLHGAVALEHLRRGNPRGAWGQWDKARRRLADVPRELAGVDAAAWRDALDAFARAIDLPERSRRHVARLPVDDLPPLPPVEDWPLP